MAETAAGIIAQIDEGLDGNLSYDADELDGDPFTIASDIVKHIGDVGLAGSASATRQGVTVTWRQRLPREVIE